MVTRITRRLAPGMLVCLLALALTGSVMAAPTNKLVAVFNTQLRAENEVTPTPSTSVAWGSAQIKVYDDGMIAWKVKIHNPAGETFTAGHIHEGSATGTGPVRQGLFSGPTTDTQLDLRGSVMNAALASELVADPANYYVNFHTTTNPPGAIRGQLP